MKSSITKIAIALVIAAVAFAGWQYLGGPSGTGVTFARAIQPILDANTAMMDIIIGTPQPDAPVMHDVVRGGRIRRTYSNLPGVVSIIDTENWRALTLTESEKRAVYTDLQGLTSMPNYLGELRRGLVGPVNDASVVENFGKRMIDGREAVGFLTRRPNLELTLWTDPHTGLPLLIEYTAGQLHVTMMNLRFDVPVEEALVSMDVPAGYQTQQVQQTPQVQEDVTYISDAGFIEGLRVLAEFVGDGQFPDSVGVQEFLKLVPAIRAKREQLGFTAEQRATQAAALQKYVMFLAFLPQQAEWRYLGKGVRLGAPNTPIFWYGAQGGPIYRVIYADLSVRNVAPENLPR